MFMRSCPRLRLAVLVFALIVGTAWAAAAQAINPSAVTLDQIDFRNGPNSVVGEITIDYALAGGSGFVNVLNPAVPSDSGWLVRNLPVFDPSTGYDHGSITTRLDLTQFAGMNGVDVTSAYLIIDYNPVPSATRSEVMSHGTSPATFPVGATQVAIGGAGTGAVSGYQAPPNLIDVQFTVLGIPMEVIYQRHHPNVQAGYNQCGPAAVANSLQFLKNTNLLFNVPHPNLPGWGGDVPNDTLVGQIDMKSGRQLGANRSDTNNGVLWVMDGKLAYIAANGLDRFLRIKHRGGGSANNSGTPLNGDADYPHMGVTSHGEGSSFDINWIFQELRDGEDVELFLRYPNGSAHYVEVVGGGRIGGMPFLLHVSDSKQSDMDPGDTLGTDHIDFDPINNATAFAAHSNATIEQVISESFVGDQLEVDSFPNTSAVLELSGPSGTDRVMLRGPATVHVAVGPNGEAVDSDGDDLDQVKIEMVQLDLTGTSAVFGPLTLRLRDPAKDPFRHSGGEIEETADTMTGRLDVPPFAPGGTASSFFDIYFEVTVQTPFGPYILHNRDQKPVVSIIRHKPPATGDTYESPQPIPLYDEDGSLSGYQIVSTKHVPRPEDVPPTCTLKSVTNGVDATIGDSGTGLFSIEVIKKENADVNVPGFALGSHGPVVVTARKKTLGVRSVVELKVTDVSGNVLVCDPVITLQVRDDGKPVSDTVSSIPQVERFVTVLNGSPGLKSLHVAVNGRRFVLSGLKDGEERTLDVAAAMQPGDHNVIVLTAHGKPGGSAEVVIHD